jgi:hypothetical protein
MLVPENPVIWVLLVIIIAGLVLIYDYIIKIHKIHILQNIKFDVSTKISTYEKCKITEIASAVGLERYMLPGTCQHSDPSGEILVRWLARYKKNKKLIYCWEYRSAIFFTNKHIVNWYQVIHAEGFSWQDLDKVAECAKQSTKYLGMNQKEKSLTVITKRSSFLFKPTLKILSSLVKYA